MSQNSFCDSRDFIWFSRFSRAGAGRLDISGFLFDYNRPIRRITL